MHKNVYEQEIKLPQPMTGAEIKAALKKAVGKEFRYDKGSHELGAQPLAYPYGLGIYEDLKRSALKMDQTYTSIVAMSNKGWGEVYAVICSKESVVSFCQNMVKRFLASLS